MLGPPVYSMQVLDRVLSSGSLDTLFLLTIVIIFTLLLLGLLQAARQFAAIRMGQWFEKQMAEKLFTHSLKMQINEEPVGNQQLRDLAKIKAYLTSSYFMNIIDIPWAIIFIIVLFMIHPYMAALAIFGGGIILLIGFIAHNATKDLNQERDERYINSMKQVEQATNNSEIITVMGMLPDMIKNWQKTNIKMNESQNNLGIRQSIFSEISTFIRTFLQIAGIGLGAFLVLKGEMTTGAIIASSAITGRVLAPFNAAILSWRVMLDALQAYYRLEDSLESYESDNTHLSLPIPKGKLSIENVFLSQKIVQKTL